MAQYGGVGGTFTGYPSKTFFNPSTGQQTLIFFFNGSPLSRIPAGYYEKNEITNSFKRSFTRNEPTSDEEMHTTDNAGAVCM